MSLTIRPRPSRVAAVLAALALLATGACSSSTDQGSSSGDGSGEGAAAAEEKLEVLYEGGSFAEPSAEGPAAKSGAKVFMVNVGTQAPTGSAVAETAREVAKIRNWDLTVFDGKFQPNAYQEGIRQALATKADAIWLYAIDCPLVKNALTEAKKAGVPVIAQEAADCDEVDPSDPSLFDESLQFSQGSFIDWGKALGASQADWLIAKTGGKAKVIEIAVPDLIIGQAVHQGFNEEMKTCEGCEIVQTIQSSAAVLGPELQTKIEQAILRNPDANGLALSYDDLVTGGGAAAVKSSGRQNELNVVSGTGFPANFKLIADDAGQNAGYGIDLAQETWAGGDLVNRVLNGEEPAKVTGIGVQMIDKEHGLPDGGLFESPITTYKDIYRKTWTGS